MPHDTLRQAADARLTGDNATAIELCREILVNDAGNHDAMSLLGVSLIEVGQIEEGRRLVTSALDASPENWRYLLNMSVLHEASNDLALAITMGKEAANHAPDRFEVWGRLGNLFGMAGNFQASAEALTKASAVNPHHDGIAFQLAAARLEIGDLSGAQTAIDAIDDTSPMWPASLRIRTHLARQLSNWPCMVAFAEEWMATTPANDPSNDEARTALTFGLSQQGFYERAAEAFRPIADREPPDSKHLAALGNLFLSARRMPLAVHYYDKALAAKPDCTTAMLGMSRYLLFSGKLKEAEAFCRRAIKVRPSFVDAYAQLAELTRGAFSEEELTALDRLRRDPTNDLDHRSIAAFAYADGHHKRRDHDKAFSAWREANELKILHLQRDQFAAYDRHRQAAISDQIKKVFPAPPSQPNQIFKSDDMPAPIFIVGMPRSGTTLLESALSAHPAITGAGELPALPIIHEDFMEWAARTNWRGGPLPRDDVAAWRERYFQQYEEYNVEPARFVIDKLPQNFLSVGLVSLIFPEAKVIHIRRNPIETGFSIFRRNFSRHWTFATSMEAIAHYYGQYAGLMNHWEINFPDSLTFVQYEELVRAFEEKLRDILKYCEIEWDDRCLEYYSADRTVITFSTVQVRKPPSAEHLNSTGPYIQQLAPLVEGLRRESIDLETGALASD